jgi:hypothetical protein
MAKKKAVKKVEVSTNPHGEAKAKLLKAKEKYRQDQIKDFDSLRRK